MTIDFSTMVGDKDWVDMSVDQASPTYFWHDGSPFADAPVDMEATFKGGMWVATNLDPAFGMNRLRVAPNFTVPRHHHNIAELIIVFEGEYFIESAGPSGGVARVGPGDFFFSDPGTPYTMTGGPDGVIYTEQWDHPPSHLRTWWHDFGWVYR